MYGNLHCIAMAFEVFEIMPVKDLIAWNSVLDAYASNNHMDSVVDLFNLMPSRDSHLLIS